MRFISVDLPEPDGPMMATYSLCLMRRVDAAQGMDLLFRAHVVGAPQIFNDDHVAVCRRRDYCFGLDFGSGGVQSHPNLILCLLRVRCPTANVPDANA